MGYNKENGNKIKEMEIENPGENIKRNDQQPSQTFCLYWEQYADHSNMDTS